MFQVSLYKIVNYPTKKNLTSVWPVGRLYDGAPKMREVEYQSITVGNALTSNAEPY